MKNENYNACWVYMYAESAINREDKTILIGSQKDFAEAKGKANLHRRRVWKHLTDEEKEFARYGKYSFYNPIDWCSVRVFGHFCGKNENHNRSMMPGIRLAGMTEFYFIDLGLSYYTPSLE